MGSSNVHVLAIPLPLQGHTNPMLQFCKRLASKGLKVTLLTMASANTSVQHPFSSIAIEYITDDCDKVGRIDTQTEMESFLTRFHTAVSKNLAKITEEKADSGCPVKVVLYDSLMPWIIDIVHNLGLKGAAFFTQACAIAAIYNHIHRGTFKAPLETTCNTLSLPSLPVLEPKDLPSFVYDPNAYPASLDYVLAENINLEKANWCFFNTFDKLETEVVRWLEDQYPIKTIGPSTPSMYVDKRIEDDKGYAINLFKQNRDDILRWLDSKEINSVVYISFGSLANLGKDQMEEIGRGLVSSNCNFLWVVRSTEVDKVPNELISEAEDRGLIVNWCPQLEVLAHEAVGCFVTHCGWNSTMEALSLGVPMVTMPVWVDQTTNSKFIVDVWQTGIRLKACESDGIVTKEEVEIVIKEVMLGEKSSELRNNALKWKELAKEAINEGGSSDKHIEEFVCELI